MATGRSTVIGVTDVILNQHVFPLPFNSEVSESNNISHASVTVAFYSRLRQNHLNVSVILPSGPITIDKVDRTAGAAENLESDRQKCWHVDTQNFGLTV